jgi:hypothetical protein
MHAATATDTNDPLVIPGFRSLTRRALPTLVEGMLIPALVLSIGTRLAGIWVGLAVALTWAFLSVGRRMVTGRRVSGVLILAALTLSARTALAGLTGNTDLYFIQPALGDAILGAGFLISLLTGGSLIERLAGDVVPVEDMIGRPCVRLMFDRITLLWGLVLLGHAALGVWMMLNQDVETYVVTRPVAAIAVKGIAVVVSALWFRSAVRRRGVPLVIR